MNNLNSLFRHPTLTECVDEWLDSKVNDDTIEEIDEYVSGLPPRIYPRFRPMESFTYYYTGMEDEDLVSSDYFYDILEPSDYLENLTEVYEKNQEEKESGGWVSASKSSESKTNYLDKFPDRIEILIPPHTNRYHANYLFKKLIDYTIEHKLFYKVTNTKTKKESLIPLIHPKFKRAFYEFCYLHSTQPRHHI